MKIIRTVLKLTMAAMALTSACAFAQDYPNRAVKIMVPFAAGGPADNYARFIAQRLTTELKQPFVVENRPGAGSIIGTDAVAKAPADGYTLLMMSNTHTVNETLVPNKPFNLGQVDMMFDAVTTMANMAKDGKVRGLATTGKARHANTLDMPTVAEAGVRGYEATIWLGLMAPKGTPPEIVNKLNAEVRKIVAQPDVKTTWASQGAVPMSMTPAEFQQYLTADIAKWATIVKISGAKPD